MFQDELQFDIAVCVLSWQMLFYLQIIFVACVASKLNKRCGLNVKMFGFFTCHSFNESGCHMIVARVFLKMNEK